MEYTSAQQILALPEPQRTRVLTQYLDELADKKQENKYGLYWNDTRHPELVVKQCDTEMPILEEVTPQYVHAKPTPEDLFDTLEKPEPTHIIIEGDNYHALAVLAYTHARKVDLIYIDPPYNTGNRDFRYNDSFVDKEDGDRHTKWLSFMHRRLLIAKELLKESGVIFISIDDNEAAQLKLLCDKVFGEKNFVSKIVWQKVYSPRMDAKGFSNDSEYLISYSKSSNFVVNKDIITQQGKQFNYFDIDKKLDYRRRSWRKEGSGSNREDRPNLFYSIEAPDKTLIFPIRPDDSEGRWRGNLSYFENLKNDNLVEFIKDKNYVWQIYIKQYLELEGQRPPSSLWLHEDVGNTHEASQELKEILGQNAFSTPKPTRLIQNVIKLTTQKDTPSVILDFFAGSGTTAHAVLELNRSDGGNRQCILVTNNEVTDKTRKELTDKGLSPTEIEDMGICRAVTYPRVKKVMSGYTTPKGVTIRGTGGKLRYFRCGFVEKQGAHIQNAENIKRHCTEMLCLRENIFQRIFPLELLPEDTDDRQNYTGAFEIFKDHNRTLAILYDDTPQYKLDLQAHLAALSNEKILYVFTPTGNVSQLDYDDFEGVRLEEIPMRILDLYKRILK